MIKLNFGENFTKPIVLCLGKFDAVHVGHTAILSHAVKEAKNSGYLSAVFTFSNDISSLFNKKVGRVFSNEEREEIFNDFAVDVVIYKEFVNDFLKLDKKQFLDCLFGLYNVKEIVVGRDYTFGYKAEGDVGFLKRYVKDNKLNTVITIIDDVLYNGNRVSSTQIKNAIMGGDLSTVENLLGYKYFVVSTVVHGRHVGRSLSFPTANLILDLDKTPLKEGVYYTSCLIDGKRYKAITNFGPCPTFGINNVTIETHLIDFCGDLYGKKIKVVFNRRLRDTIKFKNIEDLIEQLKKDVEAVTND